MDRTPNRQTSSVFSVPTNLSLKIIFTKFNNCFIYIYIYEILYSCLLFLLIVDVEGVRCTWLHLLTQKHTHTHTHTTIDRTSQDEGSARHRELYLTTHIVHKRQTVKAPDGIEPASAASERPQTQALDSEAIGPSIKFRQANIQDTFNVVTTRPSLQLLTRTWCLVIGRFVPSGRLVGAIINLCLP